jgi:hypothetical protein
MAVNDDAMSLEKHSACASIVRRLFTTGIRARPSAGTTAGSKDRSLVSLDSSYRDNGERGTSKRQVGCQAASLWLLICF